MKNVDTKQYQIDVVCLDCDAMATTLPTETLISAKERACELIHMHWGIHVEHEIKVKLRIHA